MKDESRKQQSGLSIKTLLIAGAASAFAAFVVPRFWEPGTVFAAAMTPIIVTIVSELLKRPVETVSAVTARKTTGGAVLLDPPPEEPFDPLAPVSEEELDALPETTTQRAVHRRPLTGRQWKLALGTGLLAFLCAAAFVTATELLAGETVGGGDNPTTFFSGSRRNNDRDKDAKATPSPTATATPDQREREETPTPTATATPTPTPTVTPAPTQSPQPAVPAPQSEPPASPTPAP